MTLKFLKDVGHSISSPFKHLGHSVSNLAKDTEKGIGKGIGTIHNDVKGITKGAFSIGKDVSGGFKQLTSPIGMIAIAVVVVVILARK